MANKKKGTLLLVGILGLTVALAGVVKEPERKPVGPFARSLYTDSSWNELLARVDAAQAEVEASLERTGGVRPVLHGEASADNAMDHYKLAVAMAEQNEAWGEYGFYFKSMQEASERELEEHRAFAAEVAPLVAELRRGALSGRCEYDVNWAGEGVVWQTGLHPDSFSKFDANRMLRCANRVALIELLDGNSEEALLTLLDCLQFARDMTASPMLGDAFCGGQNLVPGWLYSFGRLGGWNLFSDEQIERWIEAAATVDDGLDVVGHEALVETIINVHALPAFLERMQALYEDDYIDEDPSTPAGKAQLMEELYHDHSFLLDFAEEFVAAFAKEPLRGPSRVRKRYDRQVEDELSYRHNTINDFSNASAYRVRGLAELRLLRLGLSERIGESGAPTECRLGQPLLTRAEEGKQTYYIDTGCKGFGSSLEIQLAER